MELSPDAIIVHQKGVIDYVNRAGVRAVGATEIGDLLGRRVVELVHPDYAERMNDRLARTYSGEYASAAEEKFVRLDGSVVDVETAVMSVTQSGDPVAQLVFREITERKVTEERLTYQANHDNLTGLPNRSFFTRRLEGTLSDGPGRIAVLFLDLDGFKLVNDSLGHEYGDGLLRAVADRLNACVRPEDTVARMGGDEFTVLLQDISDVSEAENAAKRISSSLDEPFEVSGQVVFVTTSIGIAAGEAGENSASEMLRNADLAMYEAKREGGTRYKVFREGAADLVIHKLEVINELRQAVRRGEFTVHYQPKLLVATGEVRGVEALLRWRHPTRGLLYPASFMDLAEEAGLMPEIGVYVLEEALREISGWMERLPDEFRLTLGINFSTEQLGQPEITDRALKLIKGSGLAPTSLEFEITEDALTESESPVMANLLRLQEAGVSLSVDDFGTGYPSLSRLKIVPVDAIKIDQPLISGLGRDGKDAAIVAGLVDLTHALGKTVVAEGVENAAQLEYLRDLGCDFAQGNFLYPPLEAPEAFLVLREHSERGVEKPATGAT